MKTLFIILTIAIFSTSCKNTANTQAKLYKDTASMYLDSMIKYQFVAVVDDSTLVLYRENGRFMKGQYDLYKIMYDYYNGLSGNADKD